VTTTEQEWLAERFEAHRTHLRAVAQRSPAATRQLTGRARRRMRRPAVPEVELGRQREAIDAFFAAARDGDFDSLVYALDPDVVLQSDGGALRPGAPVLVRGARAVAAQALNFARLFPFVRPALVNGAAGALVAPHGRPFSVMSFNVGSGKIVEIDVLADPVRLRRLDLKVLGV
jgi:RNA polymerase sigma-70 factor, ECF subfamily